MSYKKFILNADDFGMTQEYNRAVLQGFQMGILKSASLCANGPAFDAAINEIIPECPNLGIGVHLNIIEAKTLQDFSRTSTLTNSSGEFNKGFIKLLASSYNKKFLNEVEAEFRCQIEKVLNCTKVDHLDSHVHVHAIPNIFKLTCKLAKEYGIKQVRTQFEKPYFVNDLKLHLNTKYPPNILKIILLNSFTTQNKNIIKEYDLTTNDFIIGVGYTGLMNSKTIEEGLKCHSESGIFEALIHPCIMRDPKNQHHIEFSITQNANLRDKIMRMGFEITNYEALNKVKENETV